ncbi:NUMOD4 domain-containing protein [Clostridium perfringens]|uniref:NUMOD4 domain-containing protein n=1 Tax=Clostridium perfringens TaxID=1502 RepID=UPI0028E12BC5|nr:NUMOD4 domain-containing protein [Clostridium perfringens]MDT9337789.1 NUMOD4 domain-containing protein [Clostridium perfringens]MDT9345546.1 NUMOD4 domain-containing protein [Clostridium perfringens]MDT9348789.1 NUMOD4 domain-containing protein [Clostridium perfringens]MDT9354609.1 NUMOD4 domain-containing protein [Clostridium perfringens]
MVSEEWRDIEGYEGLYQISSLGKVNSLNYNNSKKEKLLKPVKYNSGYLIVCLYKNGIMKRIPVHRLVALAFIPNFENKPYVNHKDENKSNNTLENLEWCTAKENANYGTRNERLGKNQPKVKKKNNGNSKAVLGINLKNGLILEYPSAAEAQRNGFNRGDLSECCLGRRKTHKGFKWKYKELIVNE